MTFHATIPAGRAGTCLWPLSHRSAPEFLADLTGSGKSMPQATVDRLAPIIDDVMIVMGAVHADAIAALVPGASLIVEPLMRRTMGVIGLAAAAIEARDPEVVIGSFAIDHLAVDEGVFGRTALHVAEAAEQDYVVTIGISPDHLPTVYRYIEAGESFGLACSVAHFVREPDEATAAEYLATGRYLWNAGMFVAKADVFTDTLVRFHPKLVEPLRALVAIWEVGREDSVVEYWELLESAVIDAAVAEPFVEEGGVAVVLVKTGWSDVGDYALLVDVAESNEQVALRGSEQTVLAPLDALVYIEHEPVTVAGIPETIVVDMDDALFVTACASLQDVKLTVEVLGRSGLGRLM